MDIAYNNQELTAFLNRYKSNGEKIGFVPTMGALHEGHLELIRAAQQKSDRVVVSIFVNPTQFNNKEDLEKYPRAEEHDVDLLRKEDIALVYVPQESDVYPENIVLPHFDLGRLDDVLEGEFRSGHFQGVAQVVHRFFELVKPDFAFFGLKDLQQVAVIERMVQLSGLPVSIEKVPTSRTHSGLARSSRNERLSDSERQVATRLYQTLQKGQQWSQKEDYQSLIKNLRKHFNQLNNDGLLKLEYLDLVDTKSFAFPDESSKTESIYICIAAWCNNVRLIDNVPLFV